MQLYYYCYGCLFTHQSMFDLGIEPRSKPLIVDSYRLRMDLPFWVGRRHSLLHCCTVMLVYHAIDFYTGKIIRRPSLYIYC